MNLFPAFILAFSLTFLNCSSDPGKTSDAASHKFNIAGNPKDSSGLNHTALVTRLKETLSEDFIVSGKSYFVIASNLSQAETDKIVNNTIEKAVDCFYNDYFSAKPNRTYNNFSFQR